MNRPSFLRRTPARTFRDRHDAGRALAGDLMAYRGKDNLLVLGLARGGVPVGWEVASALHAELDAFLVRKLGMPRWSELAMGAVASGGVVVMDDNLVSDLHITDEQVREAIESETAELERREPAYRRGRPVADPRGKIVILVDDGIATGASMLAARSAPYGPQVRNRSWSRCRSGRGQSAASSPGKPTTWCARPCQSISTPLGRSTPISTRSATTRCANCWPSFTCGRSSAAFGGYRRLLGRFGASFRCGLVVGNFLRVVDGGGLVPTVAATAVALAARVTSSAFV